MHNDGDTPVGRVVRGIGLAKMLVGVTPNLCHLVRTQTILLHEPAGIVGAIYGKLPVSVITAMPDQGPGISMPLD